MHKRTIIRAAVAATLLGSSALALAQDNVFKIGLILPMTGQQASTGRQIEAAAKLYMAQNGDTVAGKKVAADRQGRHQRARRHQAPGAGTGRQRQGERAGRLRHHAVGPGHRADRHPVQDARWS